MKCRYCDREFTSASGRGVHEVQCSANPNCRNIHKGRKGQVAWNKGLTKKDHPAIVQAATMWRKNYKEGNIELRGCCTPSYLGTKKHRESSSKGGGFRKNAGRGKKEYKENILGDTYLLRSSFEVKVAEWLNEHNILWKQPKSFFYSLDGVKKRYYPDFLLPEYNIIIETKNDYLMSIQEEKMMAVKEVSEIPIHILTNKDIENLNETMKNLVG